MLRRLVLTFNEQNWSTLEEQTKNTLKEELLNAVQQDSNQSIRKKIADVIAELAKFLIDEDGTNKWPEVLTFLFQLSTSNNVFSKESALDIFT